MKKIAWLPSVRCTEEFKIRVEQAAKEAGYKKIGSFTRDVLDCCINHPTLLVQHKKLKKYQKNATIPLTNSKKIIQ